MSSDQPEAHDQAPQKAIRYLVAAVWRGGTDAETWSRVEALRRRLGIVPV